MLQQHATCLQQNLLNTNTTTATATSTTTTNKKLLKANKKRLLSHCKHEKLLLKKCCPCPQRITQNLTVNNSSQTENAALHSPVWQKTNDRLFKICCKQQRQQKQQAYLVNDRTTLAIKRKWALKRWCLNGAKAQTFKTGRKQSLCQQYKPGLNSLKLRQLLARPKPKLQTQAQTALTTTLKSSEILVTAKNITNNSNMLHQQKQPEQQQQPECNLKNHAETLDFNSRRRRGRLRLIENDLKRYNTENNNNNNSNNMKNAKNNKENYVPATMFSNINAKVNNSNSNMFITTTIIIITILINIIKRIKTFVNKPTQKNNNNNKTNNNNLVLYLINKTLKQPTTTTRSHSASLSSSSSSRSSSPLGTSSFLLYAFLFALILLILPCHQSHYLAEAAKPKSATQQQQQQLHQQQHQHQQDKPLIAYAAGDDNVHIDKQGTVLTPPAYQVVSSQTSNEEDAEYIIDSDERNFDLENESINEVNEEERESFEKYDNETSYDNTTVIKTPLFPKDLFTKEQLENGAVVCHIIGVIYMFVALAIVCDEFFVPSLDVIIEKLGITDDVAGATFMAAGGSAPELFTSVIGVFVSFDDVGIGTIVGSAVFNILFVIGMCALFSKTVLTLTWWPLFRDCTFYSISLLVLIYFFRDNLIYWWEALILFSIYCAYVTFMKWNVQVETCVKRVITKNKVTRVRSTDQLMPAGNAANSSETSMATQPGGSVTSRAASESRSGPPGSSSGAGTTGNSSGANASSTQTGAKFRHGLLQLMIHTIDPLHDDDVPGKVDEKATQLHAIASLKVLLDATKPQRGGATTSAANHVKINLKETTLADRPNGNIDTTLDSQTQEIEDEPEPLSMAWPDTARKRLTYILVAPLLIPMWLTLPDTRTPKGKKLFPITFIGSIVWIAAFSYLMVWWANVAGDTARIPPEVMGLTFLAAGTSIPDLITSVIVARKGFGDMAVSSSVGSNIFDVTVGLPIPWLLYGIFYDAPVEVNSVGMVCSITILFMMLLFVVMSIACFRWRMNKGLGFTMFLLYFVFVAVSLMFEYDVITCPV
ncbi:hypothetical protein DOY81_000979 [Sarcophaga bullata]|nr:hypothetical protein DOY81_000979 [Sarcophaga bullata]